jgi:ribonuclease VapC
MIVVDSSIVVAIMREENDAAVWLDLLDQSSLSLMSVVSFVETSMVIAGRRAEADPRQTDDLLKALRIRVVPVTNSQGILAVSAFMRFGKGRNSARLNLADCFSYALSKSRNAPLLFKGNDFFRTDIVPAWQPA